jgi:uncharacterized protein (DUF2237 family)
MWLMKNLSLMSGMGVALRGGGAHWLESCERWAEALGALLGACVGVKATADSYLHLIEFKRDVTLGG